MNINKVTNAIEWAYYGIEESLTQVEGVAITNNLDLDNPKSEAEKLWAAILANLKQASNLTLSVRNKVSNGQITIG